MKTVATMGEMMIRFMPPNNNTIEQARSFDIFYGGDESIVATSLSRFGLNSRYITKLPNNVLGDTAISVLRSQNVDISYIARGGSRLGLNFYESGASMRPSKVLYDRENSAIADADPEDFDFDEIFKDADWFHISGITPALSDKTARLAEIAMQTAKRNNLTVSCDLNYRRKLWSPEKAREVMTKLMKYVDVCIGNEEDAEIMLGFKPEGTDVFKGELNIQGYKEMFSRLVETFGFKYVASTLRESKSASDNGWSALVYDGKEFCQGKYYDIHLVDRGGGGASFSAGLIYGLLTGKNLRDATEFATATSALKQTIVGDFNFATLADVNNLVAGDGSGRVQR